jgi:hypothetical protein
MRIIDAEDYLYRERPVGLSDELYEESHLYKSIMEQETIQAIPLDKIKQAINEICKISPVATTIGYKIPVMKNCDDIKLEVVAILNKLIAESEGKE